jgi:glycerol-3-phosphate dehydrogenase
MQRNLTRLAHDTFDLLVIGGGIHGLAVAYDAAQRGLGVALVERGDFGSAASFNHLKTVHGGLRYIQTADIKRMRESIVERRTVARLAPHLLTPLPFLMPTYTKVTRSPLAMLVAFAADAVIGHDRNDGVTPRLHLPTGRLVSKAEVLRQFPDVRQKGLLGGATWSDYQMRNTDRLTLAFAQAADAHGACLANYIEARGAVLDGGRVTGARVADVHTGDTFDIRATLTLNCAGAGAGTVMGFFGAPRAFPLLKAMNLVTRRPMSGPALSSSTNDGRMLFIVPWQGRAVAGTSHSQSTCGPDDQDVTIEELEAFIDEVNQAFPAMRLTREDVTLVHRGVVPAARNRRGELALEGHYQIRDHGHDGHPGAWSLVGVKYTTARGVAQVAVDKLVHALGKEAPCRTAGVPLPGGDEPDLSRLESNADREAAGQVDPDVIHHLALTYGTGYRAILERVRRAPSLAARLAPGVPCIRAEVAHAVEADMALTLVDLVTRRLPIGAAGYPGDSVAEGCASEMAGCCAWSQDRVAQELAALRRFYDPVGR